MIKRISAIAAICAFGLATVALSVLLIVNACMNSYSPYENGINKVDAKAEIVASAAMPKVKKLNVDVWRDTTLNFGEYGARINYLTCTVWPPSAITDDTPTYVTELVFRGDKYLAKNKRAARRTTWAVLRMAVFTALISLTNPLFHRITAITIPYFMRLSAF